ncbi:hypothetical protein GQX74_012995 [Glossina fuscipes]|nr:hypothetical protein GQX74_012995 [Glossina fuscipes]
MLNYKRLMAAKLLVKGEMRILMIRGYLLTVVLRFWISAPTMQTTRNSSYRKETPCGLLFMKRILLERNLGYIVRQTLCGRFATQKKEEANMVNGQKNVGGLVRTTPYNGKEFEEDTKTIVKMDKMTFATLGSRSFPA